MKKDFQLVDMSIRQIKKEDFKELYQFWLASGLYLNNFENEKKQFLRLVNITASFSYVIIENRKIVGSVLGGFNGRTVHMYHFAIAQEMRKRGYGKKLLKRIEVSV